MNIEPSQVAAALKGYNKLQSRLRRAEQLPKDGAEFLIKSSRLTQLLNKLHINCKTTQANLRTGYARTVFGGMSTDIEAVFMPQSVAYTEYNSLKKSVKQKKTDKIFPAHVWGDVLGIPYYAFPERVSAMQFIGRDGRPVIDMPVKVIHTLTHGVREGGVAAHPEIWNIDHGTLFAVESPIIYLRMLSAHYARSTDILQLVTWMDNPKAVTTGGWESYSNRKLVLCGWEMTPGLLLQAYRSSGNIALIEIADPSETGIRTFLHAKRSMQNYLNQFEKAALPWTKALARWAEKRTDAQIEGLLRTLLLKDIDIHDLLSRCSLDFSSRAAGLLCNYASRQVNISHYTVKEDRYGWSCVDHSRFKHVTCVSDAILRIDKAVYYEHSDQTLYQGRILYGEHVVNFCEPKDIVETRTFDWMRRILLQHGIGLMQYEPKWESKALLIALKMQPCEVTTGIETIGWNDETLSFELPNFSITRTGAVVPQTKAMLDGQLPAQSLEAPELITPIELSELLYDTPANAAFWAGLICVTANIVAPACCKQTTGIAVYDGNCATTVRLAANCCGCKYFTMSSKGLTMAKDEEYKHNWTIALGLDREAQRAGLQTWLDNDDKARNCLVHANWWQVRTMLLTDNWIAICAEPIGDVCLSLVKSGYKLLSAYLQDLCTRRITLKSDEQLHVLRVWQDVRNWLLELHGDVSVIDRARTYIRVTVEERVSAFAELVGDLLHRGETVVAPEGFSNTLTDLTTTDKGLFVPIPLLQRVTGGKTSLVFDVKAVTAYLKASGHLIEQRTIGDVPGWVVDSTWLAEITKRA